MAELSGVSNNFISYIESGHKNASLKTIKKIADALEITLSDLFQEIPIKKKSQTDTTEEQLLSLIHNENYLTKKSILNVCKTIIREKSRKYG
ncbi:MAG: helix-turn-helix transcriptional regulator [Elusimicrobia bacterium]|nr:helix-turn-helix transcriptional regulator [Elusimicrobiota bacterium]